MDFFIYGNSCWRVMMRKMLIGEVVRMGSLNKLDVNLINAMCGEQHKIIRKNVNLNEFSNSSYKQRLFFIYANRMRFSLSKFKTNLNPLDWCLRDVFKIVWLPVHVFVIYPLIAVPIMLLWARELKGRYVDPKYMDSFFDKHYWLESKEEREEAERLKAMSYEERWGE